MKNIVRVLNLKAGEDGSTTLFRLNQGTILQFRIGPSLLGCKVNLSTNHPVKNSGFEREKFRDLEWQFDSGNHNDATAAFVNVDIVLSGSFCFKFTTDSSQGDGSGYFLVDPELVVGPDRVPMSLDMIQCQTVLSKNLGNFQTWEDKLLVAKKSGYNMIHFTPVQVLGASNSAYSLADLKKMNETFGITDWSELERLVDKMDRDWSMLSLCDMVLNHTAKETPWLLEETDATYNCLNSPHLRPAFMLDRVLYHLTKDIEEGVWVSRGIPKAEVSTDAHLNIGKALIFDHYLPQVNIFEYFLMDIPEILEQFEKRILSTDPPGATDFENNCNEEKLKLIQDPEYRRLKSTIDLDLAMKLFNVNKGDLIPEERRILLCCSELKKSLDKLNHDAYAAVWAHLAVGVENIMKGARYHRVQPDGPRQTFCGVTKEPPFVTQYFTGPLDSKDLKSDENLMFGLSGSRFMAHNGWVMNHDPLNNFALKGSNVYLRRELVAWGDSVKLRFGEKPEDSPFIWQYMKEYAELTAKIFHGIRLDNCHSTPIHVAEFVMDSARRVRPNLYVIAELFTSSEGFDNRFINRLGINSLIREAMTAWDSHELGRLVHRFGGDPVGSFKQPSQRPLVGQMAHAMFYDQTHDNPSPVEKRSVYDMLPSAALVSMSSCACGSNRGYDELVPHHVHVVHEERTYAQWGKRVNESTGMISARKALNELHNYLGSNGYNEVYVDQMNYDIVAVTRHEPNTHQSVVLVAHTMFNKKTNPDHFTSVKPIEVEGKLVEVVFEGRIVKNSKKGEFVKDETEINGLDTFQVEMQEHFDIKDSKMSCLSHSDEKRTKIELTGFKPGSVIAFKFVLNADQSDSAQKFRNVLNEVARDDSEISEIVRNLNLLDMNHVLFKCDEEERSDGQGRGVYCLDGYGPLKYAGLQGFMSILSRIRPINDLGNWLPTNLRNGNWMLDFVASRLIAYKGTERLGRFLSDAFQPLKNIPRYLIPRYFDAIITSVYIRLLDQTWKLMSPFVQNGSNFNKALAMGSVQHTAVIETATLPTLSPNLAEPRPIMLENKQMAPTLAAGLPHFSNGYMRSWGRDTFISLRGLLILTGQYQEARYIILGYAATLRHGLIPNLLDGGKNARFNCRDATWWWLNCIVSFVNEVPNGSAILKDRVSRMFPQDDDDCKEPGVCDQALEDVMHEALQKHFQGLKFRERNAGTRIGEHMRDAGFNNEIGVDKETGFVFGGNDENCGTWMDKMGSSAKAGNKGKPSSPRDGSAVEIVGLSYATLKNLSEFHSKGMFRYNSVQKVEQNGNVWEWTMQEWADKIKSNFEMNFHVSRNNPKEYRKDLINKDLIYKDTFKSLWKFPDFQLRCNFPIAMAVAPELFDPANAWTALKIVRDKLLGPLGMATLDPDDWAYRGNYDNSNDSEDPTVAHGANYHQGPEWVWPVGFFLRAYLIFARKVEGQEGYKKAKSFVMSVLSAHFTEVQTSHWRGIPELTNAHGAFCPGSNPIQAWSMSCLLEVLYDLETME